MQVDPDILRIATTPRNLSSGFRFLIAFFPEGTSPTHVDDRKWGQALTALPSSITPETFRVRTNPL